MSNNIGNDRPFNVDRISPLIPTPIQTSARLQSFWVDSRQLPLDLICWFFKIFFSLVSWWFSTRELIFSVHSQMKVFSRTQFCPIRCCQQVVYSSFLCILVPIALIFWPVFVFRLLTLRTICLSVKLSCWLPQKRPANNLFSGNTFDASVLFSEEFFDWLVYCPS